MEIRNLVARFQRSGAPENPYHTNMVECVSRSEWLAGVPT